RLVSIEMAKQKIVLDKPIYVGFCILEHSKRLMYDFFYRILKPMYGDRLILSYMDTDSFILVIETEDVYKDLEKIKEYLDTSEFPVDHPLFSTENKKVVGKFSDESVEDGNIRFIKEYIALRSKMYYIDFDNTYAIENLKKKMSELNS